MAQTVSVISYVQNLFLLFLDFSDSNDSMTKTVSETIRRQDERSYGGNYYFDDDELPGMGSFPYRQRLTIRAGPIIGTCIPKGKLRHDSLN